MNPSPEEIATLKTKGFAIEEIDASKLGKKDIHVKKLNSRHSIGASTSA